MGSIDWIAAASLLQALAGFAGAGAVVWAATVAGRSFQQSLRAAQAQTMYETALEALSLAGQADWVFGHIRNPAGFGGEGSSRKRLENETPEETEKLNYRHMMAERISHHLSYFDRIASVEPKVRAIFGDETGDALRSLVIQRNRVVIAWQWHCRDREQGTYSSEAARSKFEGLIWEALNEPDEVNEAIRASVSSLRKHLEPFVRETSFRVTRFMPLPPPKTPAPPPQSAPADRA